MESWIFLGLAFLMTLAAVVLIVRKRTGNGLLAASFLLLSTMLVLSSTPLLWILRGRQSEDYPEWLPFLFGIPTALFVIALAAIRLFILRRRQRSSN